MLLRILVFLILFVVADQLLNLRKSFLELFLELDDSLCLVSGLRGSFLLFILLLEVLGNLCIGAGEATAMSCRIKYLSATCEEGDMKRVLEPSSDVSNHVFSFEVSVESL